MSLAVYPGSFDPITLAHLDIIERAKNVFGDVVVLIANDSNKNYMFTSEERVKLVESVLKECNIDTKNIRVDVSTNKPVAEYAKENGAVALVRGLRDLTDFTRESALETVNKNITGIETVLFFSEQRYKHISSSVIKDLANYDIKLGNYVSPSVEKALNEKIKKHF